MTHNLQTLDDIQYLSHNVSRSILFNKVFISDGNVADCFGKLKVLIDKILKVGTLWNNRLVSVLFIQ